VGDGRATLHVWPFPPGSPPCDVPLQGPGSWTKASSRATRIFQPRSFGQNHRLLYAFLTANGTHSLPLCRGSLRLQHTTVKCSAPVMSPLSVRQGYPVPLLACVHPRVKPWSVFPMAGPMYLTDSIISCLFGCTAGDINGNGHWDSPSTDVPIPAAIVTWSCTSACGLTIVNKTTSQSLGEISAQLNYTCVPDSTRQSCLLEMSVERPCTSSVFTDQLWC
jgi:hypothetical protein